jgi:type II secretory pathway component GspD/PulD (secretin)
LVAIGLMTATVSLSAALSAQQVQTTVVGRDGQAKTIARPAPGSSPDAKPERGKPQPGGPNGESNPGDDKQTDKQGDKPGEPPEPKVIRRGDRQADPPDPQEFQATVGADGKVAFQFRDQPWVDLVQWLAQIAGQPLDWQELPGDRVNLRSPGRYTVAETKDLFNRHLLARGYTLLELPGGITVAKTEGINPALVPRVGVEELDELMPHTFVRTSLEPGWLPSDKLAEELKPMISSNGRLTALTTTNRLEAMDAAINLRQIAGLLEQERNQSSRDALAPEFRLRFISAQTAKTMLEQFLGVEKKSAAPLTPQQLQMMQQMAQRGGNKPVPEKKEPEISIVADTRQNTLYVRAPADRIAVATEFINRIDVPGQTMNSLSDVESRLQVFRLYSIDPEKLIDIIAEMNVLEPTTHVRADEDNQALIVSGSAADRYIIERLIKRLDGSGRQFEVLQLRRLDATEVAESIAFLMGKDKDKKKNDNSRRYFYYGFGGNNEETTEEDEFRVAANARYRQVLLWANESEMEQVRNLLVKLGEMPPPGGSRSTIRRIDASAGPETYEYLLQLQERWSEFSNAPLRIPDRNAFIDPAAPPQADPGDGDDPQNTAEPESIDVNDQRLDSTRNQRHTDGDAFAKRLAEPLTLTNAAAEQAATPPTEADSQSAAESQAETDGQAAARTQTQAEATGSAPDEDADASPPIRSAREFDRAFGLRGEDERQSPDSDSKPSAAITIELDQDGNLVLMGSDTRALDQLENLMLHVAPPRRPYHVFKIKHQSAFYIQLNLEEYFEATEGDDTDDDSFARWYFGFGDQETDDGPSGLARNNELRFVQDPDTNTIVVSGATNGQLRTIKELIQLWDVAEPANKRRMRYTKLVSLQYGSAEQIAETIKEAYRDLLSSNDKTFQAGGRGGGGGPRGGQPQKSSGRENQGSGLVDSDNGRDGGDVDFSFKGKLSMGIDSVGNTLLVSAEGEPLLELVVQMIEKLDQAAKPGGDVQIMSVRGNTSDASIESLLKAFGGNPRSPLNSPAAAPRGPRPEPVPPAAGRPDGER